MRHSHIFLEYLVWYDLKVLFPILFVQNSNYMDSFKNSSLTNKLKLLRDMRATSEVLECLLIFKHQVLNRIFLSCQNTVIMLLKNVSIETDLVLKTSAFIVILNLHEWNQMSTCVLLQWVFNFLITCPFANFILTASKHPLYARYSFLPPVTYNFELMGWYCTCPPRQLKKSGLLLKATGCSSTGPLKPEVSSPLLSIGEVTVSPQNSQTDPEPGICLFKFVMSPP